jgi:hypothetical protein
MLSSMDIHAKMQSATFLFNDQQTEARKLSSPQYLFQNAPKVLVVESLMQLNILQYCSFLILGPRSASISAKAI